MYFIYRTGFKFDALNLFYLIGPISPSFIYVILVNSVQRPAMLSMKEPSTNIDEKMEKI